MKALTLGVAAAVMLSGCSESDETSLQAAANLQANDGGVGAPVHSNVGALEQATLDVLFVIDNSGSMANKQVKLASQIPRMINVLNSGDNGRFTPVRSLHVGVVTTNFGGSEADGIPVNAPPALESCLATGDQGALQNSVLIASSGIVAAYDNEFPGVLKGDVVFPPQPDCQDGLHPLYQTVEAGSDATAAANQFSCQARVGVRGCPYEQPLESMWAALAPSTGTGDLYKFLNDTRGNGDRVNSGFLRPNAALAVVILTDEDDCSITQLGKKLNSYADKDGDPSRINLRCYESREDPTLEHAVTRYRDGLLSLKPGHEDRVVFTVIAGLPLDAASRSFDSLLADPSMQQAEDPNRQGFPRQVCANDSRPTDMAYPARRLLETAKLFPNAVAASICGDDYAPAIDATINKIAPLMAP